jgi:hypothetical protein
VNAVKRVLTQAQPIFNWTSLTVPVILQGSILQNSFLA